MLLSADDCRYKKFFFSTIAIFFVLPFFIYFNVASAEVVIYDDVVTINRAVKLKAITKGKFFPEGGRLVEFYVNEKHIGTTLSGGDGYAFMKYLPHSGGIKNLKIKMDSEIDEGKLLVTEKNDRVLLIEIESILSVPKFRDFLQLISSVRKQFPNNIKESKKVLQQLLKRFRIIYLTTMIGIKESRKWLKENGFPTSAVLKWQGNMTIEELHDKGVRLHAIIASPDVLSEALDIKKRFSFEETEDGVVVDDWKDLLKQLK